MIDNVLVDDRVASAYFRCDVQRCRGACCTFEGGSGAPLLPEEVEVVESIVPIVLPDLLPEVQREIQERGVIEWEEHLPLVRCIDRRACVFAVYEDGVARCAIEKAYFAGKVDFRKPLSCHLFPIREIRRASLTILVCEEIPECKAGWERGERERVRLTTAVREALVRRYGEQWYRTLRRLQGCVGVEGVGLK